MDYFSIIIMDYFSIIIYNHSISLLASIYIEDSLESASHNSYFFVRCKIKL